MRVKRLNAETGKFEWTETETPLEKLIRVERMAKSGRWSVREYEKDWFYIVTSDSADPNSVATTDREADAELIALARNLLPDLLRLVEAVREEHRWHISGCSGPLCTALARLDSPSGGKPI